MAFVHQSFLKSLTQRPGIYQMLDGDGQVLYVGKAKNLKNRVTSYFRKTGLTPKTAALVKRIVQIDVTVTETETEALILEHNLIKQYRPQFNILMRDDKSYPYIFLSDRDQWPRLSFHRGPKKAKGTYFGPFPSVHAVRDSMSFLQKTFRVRQCEDVFFKNRSRPCLQYQIKRCSAPCVGFVEPESYAADVNLTRLYLDGKAEKILQQLERDMEKLALALEFEKAGECRDQISALRQVQAQQMIEKGRGTIDVVAGAVTDGQACVHMLYVRQGRILGSRSYYPKAPLAEKVSDLLDEFLPHLYLSGGGRPDLPKEILVNAALDGAEVLTDALKERIGRNIEIRDSVRGFRAKWIELAQRTAEQNLAGKLASKQTLQQRFESLRDTIGLDETPERLECFDISHSSGEAVVASCVVFDSNGALKSDYRRFNIENITGGDDYAAMEQAIRRRYTRLMKGEGKLPDILLIDGGKGQIGITKSVLADLGVVGVIVLGVAKGTTRKPGMETLILADQNNKVIARPQQAALHLIQQIRDEAHRFAITGHKQRRDKKRRTSALEGIPGVGPTRRRDLLKHFGGIVGVKKASVADLMKVANINKKVAEAIYGALYND
ncbi:MAG: excinuclease ABC subunit UvrC [Porticoccaceae bacterium]|nr:excinuclease ABC subunit UvrC [Porticoccaceae bacterium]MBT6692746.1 excinuclease ABC subunit UvrC [Porticoccaceae bacterium]MBT6799886.1 excinuclease ABC subunit UvrC [Porticoccaceae bacterium]MBT7167238.1 excinuclease ABC subunit UvrC [Porticoccaceae bacterium]MBT7963211.1 excinuclease ABC subunit UvrC [Porticoccaceae bacterium]